MYKPWARVFPDIGIIYIIQFVRFRFFKPVASVRGFGKYPPNINYMIYPVSVPILQKFLRIDSPSNIHRAKPPNYYKPFLLDGRCPDLNSLTSRYLAEAGRILVIFTDGGCNNWVWRVAQVAGKTYPLLYFRSFLASPLLFSIFIYFSQRSQFFSIFQRFSCDLLIFSFSLLRVYFSPFRLFFSIFSIFLCFLYVFAAFLDFLYFPIASLFFIHFLYFRY